MCNAGFMHCWVVLFIPTSLILFVCVLPAACCAPPAVCHTLLSGSQPVSSLHGHHCPTSAALKITNNNMNQTCWIFNKFSVFFLFFVLFYFITFLQYIHIQYVIIIQYRSVQIDRYWNIYIYLFIYLTTLVENHRFEPTSVDKHLKSTVVKNQSFAGFLFLFYSSFCLCPCSVCVKQTPSPISSRSHTNQLPDSKSASIPQKRVLDKVIAL